MSQTQLGSQAFAKYRIKFFNPGINEGDVEAFTFDLQRVTSASFLTHRQSLTLLGTGHHHAIGHHLDQLCIVRRLYGLY